MAITSTLTERFQHGLDLLQPDWFITFATQQELIDFARLVTDGGSGTVSARLSLRRAVATRLLIPLRAANYAGIVTGVKQET